MGRRALACMLHSQLGASLQPFLPGCWPPRAGAAGRPPMLARRHCEADVPQNVRLGLGPSVGLRPGRSARRADRAAGGAEGGAGRAARPVARAARAGQRRPGHPPPQQRDHRARAPRGRRRGGGRRAGGQRGALPGPRAGALPPVRAAGARPLRARPSELSGAFAGEIEALAIACAQFDAEMPTPDRPALSCSPSRAPQAMPLVPD